MKTQVRYVCALSLVYVLLASTVSFANAVPHATTTTYAVTYAVRDSRALGTPALPEATKVVSTPEKINAGATRKSSPQIKHARKLNHAPGASRLKATTAGGGCACGSSAALREAGGNCFDDCLQETVSAEAIAVCAISCGIGLAPVCAACLVVGVAVVVACAAKCIGLITKNENMRRSRKRDQNIARGNNANHRAPAFAPAG